MPEKPFKPDARSNRPVLAIESATFCSSVAILSDEGVMAMDLLNAQTNHSGRLMPLIERLLRQSGLDCRDLGAVAVSIGPGSFTGIRVGLSLAKGLSLSAGLPIIGIPTLEALARRYFRKGWDVCPVIDARRAEVYAALFSVDRSGTGLRRKCNDAAIPIEAFLERLKRKTIFLGDGARLYRKKILKRLGENAQFAPPDRFLPSADAVAAQALQRLRANDVDISATLAPSYVRQPDARLPIFR